MKIESIEAIPVSIPCKRRRLRYMGPRTHYRNTLVKVGTDEGITGVGEANNELAWGESQGVSVHVITEHFSRLLIGEDPFDIETLIEKMDTIGAAGQAPLYAYAKCAIDLALHDIMGKVLNIPVYKLLGGSYRKRVPCTTSIRILEDMDELRNEATELVEMGFKSGLKTKAGRDPEKDVETVKILREVIGDGKPIICDPNGGYTPKTAIRIIKKMERYGPIIMEQPVPGWDIDGMAKVCRAVDSPILADESIWTPKEALMLIKKAAADMFNIYISKSGGLYNSKKIALIAEAAGIHCVTGTGGAGVYKASGLHLIAATKNLAGPMVLDPFPPPGSTFKPYILDDIIKEPFRYVLHNGVAYVEVPEKPGLGVELDEDKVNKYRQKVTEPLSTYNPLTIWDQGIR